MTKLVGHLTEYSLAEVFHTIETGKKTGLLTIEPKRDTIRPPVDNSYLWFQGGRLMAITHNLHQTTLLKLLQQRQWLAADIIPATISASLTSEQPLGLYLKSQGLLSTEQLKLIFNTQVMQPVFNLFKLDNARFMFDSERHPIKAEMTGLSISGTEATLLGLRSLRDWSRLMEKLPDPESSLIRRTNLLPNYKFDRSESSMWELATGKQSLTTIAQNLGILIDEARKIAFRLTVVGLLQEVANEPEARDRVAKSQQRMPIALAEEQSGLTGSFLNNLMGFLNKKKKVA